MWMGAQRSFIVIVGQHPSRLLAHFDVFERPVARGCRPILVFLNGLAAGVLERFTDPIVVDAKEERQPLAEVVIEHVLSHLPNAKT